MNLRQLFDLSLVARKDETGLEWAGAEYTFGEIDARSNRLANALRARGIVCGDRVAVYLANCIEMLDLYLRLGSRQFVDIFVEDFLSLEFL